MRLACDSCGEVGRLQLELAGGERRQGMAATVTCEHCGASAEVPGEVAGARREAGLDASAEAKLDPGEPASSTPPGARSCPKCHAEVGDRPACPGCGLASARMAGFSASRAAEVPEPVLAAWQAVLATWEVQARHDAFVQAVAAAGAFAWAAGRYQVERRRRAGDAIAARQLDRVRRTAEAAMLASAAVHRSEQAPYRGATAILVMMVVVLVAGALYATFMRETRPSGATGAGTPVVPARRGALHP